MFVMKNNFPLDIPFPVSEKQRQIICENSRYIKVEAAAGTGKTETIARKIIYSIVKDKIDPKSIVAFTFTEKAAKEMKNRVYDIANSQENKELYNQLNEIYIGTIHAYCKNILEDYFSYADYTLFDDNKEIAYLLRRGWELGINEYENGYTRKVLEFHKTKNMVYNEMINESELRNKAHDFYDKLENYEKHLKKDKIMTFGTIVRDLVVELKKDRTKLNDLNLSFLFVDEFQDINPVQYELIKLLCSINSRLMVVGDERQTIYQWRGSNHEFFQRIEKDLEGVKIFYLDENRRSAKNIVLNANCFAKTIEGKFHDMIPIRSENDLLNRKSFINEYEEARWIVDNVQSLISSGALKYGDIAVLLRSVRTKGKIIIDQFREKKIPYQVGGKTGLFQRDDGQILGMLFSWIIDKEWKTGTEKLQGQDLINRINEMSIKVFHLHSQEINKIDFEPIKRRIEKTSIKQKYENITQIFQDMLTLLHFKNLDPENPEDAIVMANIGRFNELLTDFETARRVGGKHINWKSDLKALYYFIITYAHDSYEEAQPDLDYNANAVQIMTVHQAKGLEWPLVILPELNKSVFPSSMVGKAEKWFDIPRDAFDSKRYEGSDDDERRLFYVAITRPKNSIVITYISGKESTYISDMDINCFGKYNVTSIIFDNEREEKSSVFEFSPNELIEYYRCPYMYQLRAEWGFQPGLKEEIGFGNAMHSVLRNAVKLVKQGEIGTASAIKESSERYFHLPFAGSSTHYRLKSKSEDILDNFIRKYPEFLLNAEDVEYRIIYRNGKISLSGRADVILSGDQGYTVADYKTNKDVSTKEELEIQIGAYAIGLRKSGKNVILGKIAYLEECEVEDMILDDRKIGEIEKKIEELIMGIETNNFNPRVSEYCEECDMRRLCRYGGYNE